METPLAVLIIEDSEGDAQLILRLLKRAGYEVAAEQVEDAAQMRAALRRRAWDLVISDYSLPRFSGRDALEILKEERLDIPFIVVSGTIGEESAVAMMKAGAHDYLVKDDLARLVPAVQRELEQAVVRSQRRLSEEALRRSEEKYRMLVEQAADGIFLISADGRFLDVNPAGCKLSGYTREEILGATIQDAVANLKNVPLRVDELLNGEVLVTQREVIRKDGSSIWVEVSARRLPDGNYQGVVRDVTERKRTEDKLRQLSSAVEHGPASIVITDIEGRIEYVNPKFTEITGFTLEEVLGKTPYETFGSNPPEEPGLSAHWRVISEGGEWKGEMLNRRKNGETYWEAVSISPIKNEQGVITHFVAVGEDVTERKEAEDKIRRLNAGLEQLAVTDYLTSLYNRRYFMQRGEEEFKRTRRASSLLSVLMLDIDHFKKVNDAYGHEAGDMALQQVAAALKASMRETDILARIGGEEFAVLLPGAHLKEASLLARRIRQTLAGVPLHLAQTSLTITVSIGVCEILPAARDIGDLLKYADQAMYTAKRYGGNRVISYGDESLSEANETL
ncbi:MAG: PAS domain S-box protein [Chloroflexi bacterium]|nr:PAS domain S-box protein [Chloroflexota bacterium]